mgnify:CR=1 FL=1
MRRPQTAGAKFWSNHHWTPAHRSALCHLKFLVCVYRTAAGKLESRNIVEYETAARHAQRLRSRALILIDCLLTTAEVEEHESMVLSVERVQQPAVTVVTYLAQNRSQRIDSNPALFNARFLECGAPRAAFSVMRCSVLSSVRLCECFQLNPRNEAVQGHRTPQ